MSNEKTSDGLIWIIYDEYNDPIQAWDCPEYIVKAHVKKYGWSYSGLPAYRSLEPTTSKILETKSLKSKK